MKNLKLSLLALSMGTMMAVTAQEKNNDMPPQREDFFEVIDANADGELSLEEFKTGKEKMEAKHLERRKEMFKEMDVDGNGQISASEFENFKPKRPDSDKKEGKKGNKMKKGAGKDMRNMSAEDLFAELDKDGDGTVSKEEFKAHRKGGKGRDGKPCDMPRKRMNAEEVFAKIDADGNEVITLTEMENAKRPGAKKEMDKKAIFEEMDADGNGEVTLAEFEAVAQKRKKERKTN